jgi:hypothetical protein
MPQLESQRGKAGQRCASDLEMRNPQACDLGVWWAARDSNPEPEVCGSRFVVHCGYLPIVVVSWDFTVARLLVGFGSSWTFDVINEG